MYRIDGIKLETGEPKDDIPVKIRKKLGRNLKHSRISSWKIVKESLDARNKSRIQWVYTVDFEIDPHVELKLNKSKEEKYMLPKTGNIRPDKRPVICGFGPAGMFCALILSEAGLDPLVIERGKKADERAEDVNDFWENGKLDTESNVQFGEGGAGTFSDGKLTTGIKDTRIIKVLSEFVENGAEKDILYKQKPHIGTDVLRTVVTGIRKKIIANGGEILFSTRLDDIAHKEGRLTGITVSSPGNEGKREQRDIDADVLVIASGHSARDTVRMLIDKGISAEQKPFSIGMRIEHSQEMIDIAQYGGPHRSLGLPPAEYKLSCRTSGGRGVYTFCMCPGGHVITASSQPGGIVTNGMSYHARDGLKANSAVLVDVKTSDFGSDDPVAGIVFQEKYERLAFKNGGGNYRAPVCSLGEFKDDASTKGKKVRDSIPDFAEAAIKEAIPLFAEKLRGFDDESAVLTAVESRSSSPVRLLRDEERQSSIKGIYPAGEGAGYAGGIVSAAVDGIRTAEKIIERYMRLDKR